MECVMPGIAGIFSKKRIGHEEQKIRKMLECTLHEKFYISGVYSNKDLHCFVAYCTIANSFAYPQPIVSKDGSVIMLFTGECYAVNNTLCGNMQKIMDAYCHNQASFFTSLNGCFNGLIIDLNKKNATLFNDRFGIRRVYYYENEEAFYFSSEAKSILAVIPECKRLNPHSVAEYLLFDCPLEDKTFFNSIFLLPAGSAWTFDGKKLKKNTYFSPKQWESLPLLSEDDFLRKFDQTFRQILPRYFQGDKVGLSLTGGLDTRMILSYLNPLPNTLPCYTFGGSFKDVLDVRLAPAVARACNQQHFHLKIEDADLHRNYEKYLQESIYMTDGVTSVDTIDSIPFNRMAREIAPIRVTGKYGSQVMKHVLGFKERAVTPDLINADFNKFLSAGRETLRCMPVNHPFSFLLFKEIPWWWNGFVIAESSQVAVRSPFLDNDLVELIYQAPKEQTRKSGEFFQLSMIGKNNPSLLALPSTSHGGTNPFTSYFTKKAFTFLGVIDKLVIREKLPYNLTDKIGRVDAILSKVNLNKVYAGYSYFRRYRSWYRDELSGFIKDTLLSTKTLSRPYWVSDVLKKIVNDHISGRRVFYREIRKVLQIEMIHRVLIDDNEKNALNSMIDSGTNSVREYDRNEC
jgi:asparagine synthase (glutamine-hydrolysing)